MTVRTLRTIGDRSCRRRLQGIDLASSSSSSFSSNAGLVKRGFRTTNGVAASSQSDRLLVVGSGVAGSAAALIAAETHKIPVTMLFAGSVPGDCNSWWAQGGIIYRNYNPASGDSAESLAKDIHRAGAGLCDDFAVRKVSEEGPDRVKELLLNAKKAFADVPFDKTPDGELSLCLGTFCHALLRQKARKKLHGLTWYVSMKLLRFDCHLTRIFACRPF